MNAPAWGVRVPGSELKSEGGGRGSIRRPSTENTEGKMKSTLATILIGLALLGGIAFGGYTLYERHISTEARAAVLAALGDNVNDADVAVYLRTAKLAIRTKRDAYIVGLLDKTVEQAEKAREINRNGQIQFLIAALLTLFLRLRKLIVSNFTVCIPLSAALMLKTRNRRSKSTKTK